MTPPFQSIILTESEDQINSRESDESSTNPGQRLKIAVPGAGFWVSDLSTGRVERDRFPAGAAVNRRPTYQVRSQPPTAADEPPL